MMKFLGSPYVKLHWWHWWLAKQSIIVYVISHWTCERGWEKATGPRRVMRFMVIPAVDIKFVYILPVSHCSQLLWMIVWILQLSLETNLVTFSLLVFFSFPSLCPVCHPHFPHTNIIFLPLLFCHKLVTRDGERKNQYTSLFYMTAVLCPTWNIIWQVVRESQVSTCKFANTYIPVVLSLCHLVCFHMDREWRYPSLQKQLSLCYSLCNSQTSLFFSL